MNIKRINCILACLVLAPVIAVAQNVGNRMENKPDPVETEVLRLEEMGRQKALAGDTEWDGLMADGAFLIGADGAASTYRKGKAFPSFPMISFTLSELIARNYGETVVVTGLGEIEVQGPDKKSVSFKMRYVNVWRKFRDGWKIVVSELTNVKPVTPPKQS
jgi:ketosteroid isomerase-like protein